jgi:hypothetical protein
MSRSERMQKRKDLIRKSVNSNKDTNNKNQYLPVICVCLGLVAMLSSFIMTSSGSKLFSGKINPVNSAKKLQNKNMSESLELLKKDLQESLTNLDKEILLKNEIMQGNANGDESNIAEEVTGDTLKEQLLAQEIVVNNIETKVKELKLKIQTKELESTNQQKLNVLGPILIKSDNQSLRVSFSQSVRTHTWSAVNVDVLDSNKKYLFSFSDEFWAETGYDSDGSWSDSKKSSSTDILIKKQGSYFFKVTSETNSLQNLSPINIRVNQKAGSGIPFFVLGLVFLVIGIILGVMGENKKHSSTRKSVDFGEYGAYFFIFIIFILSILFD